MVRSGDGALQGEIEKALSAGVAAAPVVHVEGEAVSLAPKPPVRYLGTSLSPLRSVCRGVEMFGVPGALLPGTLRLSRGSQTLRPGEDYVLDPFRGTLGQPEGRSDQELEVRAEYAYTLRRLDAMVRTTGGEAALREGASHLGAPHPPPLEPGEQMLAGVFVDYGAGVSAYDVFPVAGGIPPSATAPGRLARVLAKLRSGEAAKIVFWGDSITAGGDASSSETTYGALVEQELRRRFPSARLECVNVAVGGGNSATWLYPAGPEWAACDWERIADECPDLVSVEFINDCGLCEEQLSAQYEEILSRIRELGAEALFITGIFTMPEMMGITDLARRTPGVARRSSASSRRSSRWRSPTQPDAGRASGRRACRT